MVTGLRARDDDMDHVAGVQPRLGRATRSAAVRLQSLAGPFLGAVTVVLGSLGAAWSMTDGPFGELVPLIAAVTFALVLVGRWNFGAFVALLVLVVLNGIPGPDLQEFAVAGSFRISDVAVLALIVALAFRQQGGPAQPGSLLRFVRWWAVALAAWWLLTLTRSVADGVPLLQASLFSRDFLYFAILLPLLAGALRNRREVAACLSVLAAGAVLHAAGQVAIAAGGVNSSIFDLFIHAQISISFEGTQRIYAYMADAVTAAFPFAIGLALIPPRRPLRLVGIGLAILTGTSVLFQFTRATYLALALALLVVSASWMYANGAISQPLRRSAAAIAAVVVITAFASGFRPLAASVALPSETAAVSERARSTIDDLRGSTGNVGYRYDLIEEMLTHLDDRWPVGLGFLHPDVRPVSSLPDGSIRNGDVGVLNAVMTMGVIGAALMYVPLVALFVATMRRRGDSGPAARGDQWFFFGAATWILYAVMSSGSLVTLFSVPGLMLTATLLACSVCLIDQMRRRGAK
jgi:hypothetical protein